MNGLRPTGCACMPPREMKVDSSVLSAAAAVATTVSRRVVGSFNDFRLGTRRSEFSDIN